MAEPLLMLRAARSYRAGGEDRLTELFATALDAHPGFCGELHDRLGLPRGENYVIETQHRISPGCRLDMRIGARDASGAVSSVVYSEHKLDGYWFSEGQVARERAGLENEQAAEKRLICIVSTDELSTLRSADPATPAGTATAADFDEPLSWADIARLASQAGRSWPDRWGGTDWKDLALEPSAPAAQRVLIEFLDYLGEDEVPEAISANDLLAFRLADQAQAKVESMLVLAAEHVQQFPLSADPDSLARGESSVGVPLTSIDFELPEDHWLIEDEDSVLSVAVATTNASAPWDGEGPHVYAGLYLYGEPALAAQADGQWMSAAAVRDLRPLAYEPGLWMVATALLSDFTTAGDTIEAQAAALGKWLAEVLESCTELGPPRAAPGAAEKQRTRRR